MAERIDVTLSGLREVLRRIECRGLEDDDYPLFGALVSKLIDRAEARQARAIAKIAKSADAAANEAAGGLVIDAEYSEHEGDSTSGESASDANSSPGARATSEAGGGGATGEKKGKKKSKGHGRNGADAYSKAKHFFVQSQKPDPS